MTELQKMGAAAKKAAAVLRTAGEKKRTALNAAAAALRARQTEILAANEEDLKAAKENGMSEAMLDRLALTPARIEGMAKGVEDVSAQRDPVGRILSGETNPKGLKVEKITVPMGVIGIIYEARPNVTSDAAALCLMAGSAVILRGGKEAFRSNNAIAEVLRDAIESAGLPRDSVQLVQDTSRASSVELMGMTEYLDLLIPRGGAGLIRAVVENAKVPVIETGVGNCHVYVDKDADIEMAANIIFNAKTSRPSVCNAIETILVHKDIAEAALPVISNKLKEKNVELRGDKRTCELLPEAKPATEADWATEYLDYILAVRIVDSLDAAIAHIAQYSTGHSECIVTENLRAAERFTAQVDAAAVYVNASTRFTDGGELGLGAEIGISTQKLHARGPMGLNELVSYKFIIRGDGQIRKADKRARTKAPHCRLRCKAKGGVQAKACAPCLLAAYREEKEVYSEQPEIPSVFQLTFPHFPAAIPPLAFPAGAARYAPSAPAFPVRGARLLPRRVRPACYSAFYPAFLKEYSVKRRSLSKAAKGARASKFSRLHPTFSAVLRRAKGAAPQAIAWSHLRGSRLPKAARRAKASPSSDRCCLECSAN